MEVSWAWLIVGLVLGTALGLMVMGALAERKVQEAQEASYDDGHAQGWREGQEQLAWREQRWEEREQKWTAMVLELSATVEKFSPARMAACPPEIE